MIKWFKNLYLREHKKKKLAKKDMDSVPSTTQHKNTITHTQSYNGGVFSRD